MLAAVERRRCESRARCAAGSREAWRLMVCDRLDKWTETRATVRGRGEDEGEVPSRFAETREVARFRRRDLLHRQKLAAAEDLGKMIEIPSISA